MSIHVSTFPVRNGILINLGKCGINLCYSKTKRCYLPRSCNAHCIELITVPPSRKSDMKKIYMRENGHYSAFNVFYGMFFFFFFFFFFFVFLLFFSFLRGALYRRSKYANFAIIQCKFFCRKNICTKFFYSIQWF